jgi:hypothetical protein
MLEYDCLVRTGFFSGDFMVVFMFSIEKNRSFLPKVWYCGYVTLRSQIFEASKFGHNKLKNRVFSVFELGLLNSFVQRHA